MSLRFFCGIFLVLVFSVQSFSQEENKTTQPSQKLIAELETKKKHLEQDEIKQKKALDVLLRLNSKIKNIVKNKYYNVKEIM